MTHLEDRHSQTAGCQFVLKYRQHSEFRFGMKLTEHQLKEIHQRGTNRQRNSGCPSADELFQLLSNSLDSQKRLRIGSHLEGCRDCSEEFRMARELSEELVKTSRGVSIGKKPEWRPLLAAAVIVLALTAGIIFYKRTTFIPADTVERGEHHLEFRTEPADGAQLDTAPAKLKWSAIPDVQAYRVVLLNYESAVITESGPRSSTEFSLSDEIRNKLQPGQVYYWRIEYERAGEQQSKLLRFSIR